MSLFTSQSRFLTLRPSIYEQDNSLVIKTGFLARLLSLFLNIRTAEIDPQKQAVTLSHSPYKPNCLYCGALLSDPS